MAGALMSIAGGAFPKAQRAKGSETSIPSGIFNPLAKLSLLRPGITSARMTRKQHAR